MQIFSEINSIFSQKQKISMEKENCYVAFEGKQDIIGNKSIHQVYAFIKSKRKKRKNRKKKSEKKEKQSECGGMIGQKEKRGATMRIQEVIKKTGLSRRTVYYYIDQKMISPVVDEHNGYHDFSEADIQKLLSSASCARQDFHWRISARFFTSRAQHHFICINS